MLRIEFGCVLYCNADAFLGKGVSCWTALAGSAGESLSQQHICVTWIFLDTGRSWPYLQCWSALLGRTAPSWASFFYTPVTCPRQFAWVKGHWFMEFFCARLQFLLSSIIAILRFFSPTSILPYFTKLSRAVRLKHVHILPLQNISSVAHINVYQLLVAHSKLRDV